MQFNIDQLEDYIQAHTSPETEVLYQLNRQTNLHVMLPQMLSGPLQGTFLQMISQMMRPKCVLEIGTFTGYSSICLCAGLQENGILHTIDINEQLEQMQSRFFEKAGLKKQIKQYVGDALEIIPNIKETFDLVFLDADKVHYQQYYELVLPKLRKGGFILADNVLWSGKVMGKAKPSDEDTQALQAFNDYIQADERVNNLLLPFRDGIMMIGKK